MEIEDCSTWPSCVVLCQVLLRHRRPPKVDHIGSILQHPATKVSKSHLQHAASCVSLSAAGKEPRAYPSIAPLAGSFYYLGERIGLDEVPHRCQFTRSMCAVLSASMVTSGTDAPVLQHTWDVQTACLRVAHLSSWMRWLLTVRRWLKGARLAAAPYR